jgi:tellurite resistance protein TehA-like permease
MKNLVDNLKNLPVAVSGLALGVAGLGNLLANEVYPGFRYLCGLITLILLSLVLIKKLKHPQVMWIEITHPVAGSFIPTFDMALMIIASIIVRSLPLLGQLLWYLAIILHVIFASCFIYQQLKNFDFNHMLPSWFIPPVGIVVACVTSEPMHAVLLSKTIFYIGFTAYLILLPLMLYRIIFGNKIEDRQLPSFAIMAAPASLCLVGYLTVFNHAANPTIVHLLFTLELMMTSLVLISILRINHFRIKFIPIYASFTFPLVIGATGLIRYARYLGLNNGNGIFWYHLGIIQLIIACVVVVWVFAMMSIFVNKNVFNVK